jgi:hypothetical protein
MMHDLPWYEYDSEEKEIEVKPEDEINILKKYAVKNG